MMCVLLISVLLFGCFLFHLFVDLKQVFTYAKLAPDSSVTKTDLEIQIVLPSSPVLTE